MWSDVLHEYELRGADGGHKDHLVWSGGGHTFVEFPFWYSSMYCIEVNRRGAFSIVTNLCGY
jgi:hypothetical protein